MQEPYSLKAVNPLKMTALFSLAALCSVFFLSPGLCGETAVPETIIRVGIAENIASVNIGAESDYEAVELNTSRKTLLPSSKVFLVAPSENGIRIGSLDLQSPVRLVPLQENKFVRIDGRRYRDSLIIQKNANGKLTVINELGLDGYLYGILPREVSPDWPFESLKAQAVASRSYALKNMHRHDSSGFFLCSTVHCQVYGGVEGETDTTTHAVDETHNEVLTYNEDMASTYFFANCGGRTEVPSIAWDSSADLPYLKSVKCKYCRNEEAYTWEKEISEETIARALKNKGYKLSEPISAIKVRGHGHSGRALNLEIRHKDGLLKIRASLFRAAVGSSVIRSTLFTAIKKKRNGYIFRGQGWGHGVGLCQHGAKGAALNGFSYTKILKLYYPGAILQRWEE